MKMLILNGSPKKKSSTSRFLSKMLSLLLIDCNVQSVSLRTKSIYPKIMQQFNDIDVLIVVAPLYLDGIPSHILEFLQQAEAFCIKNSCHFSVYAISNNGFIEGIHNKSHLKMYECWCKRSGLMWRGGIGIGGGEMFRCLTICYFITFAILIVINLIYYLGGIKITFSDWLPLIKNIGIYILFNCGIFYYMIRLSKKIRKLEQMKNSYTRVMIPAFLFIPIADVFMFLTSLFNGKFIFKLLKKDRYSHKL